MSEWKTDDAGRRYRIVKVGEEEIRDYEMDITTSYGTISQSKLEAVNRLNRQNLVRAGSPQKIKAPENPNPDKICPFKEGMTRKCDRGCAFFAGGGCMKSQGDTAGRKCPFNSYPCMKDCALYSDGCKVMRVMREVLK